MKRSISSSSPSDNMPDNINIVPPSPSSSVGSPSSSTFTNPPSTNHQCTKNKHNDNNQQQQQQHPDDDSSRNYKQFCDKFISKYNNFLKKNRVFLKLAEECISRLVLYSYAPSTSTSVMMSSHSHDNVKSSRKIGVLPETLYAFINLWSLFNDCIYYGIGNGNGLTVGSLTSTSHDQDYDETSSDCAGKTSTTRPTRKNNTISFLRCILSVVECLAPALEAHAYHHEYYNHQSARRQSRSKTKGSNTTSTTANNNTSNMHIHTLNLLTKIELVKFSCRLGILALNYSNIYNQCQQASTSTSTSTSTSKTNMNHNNKTELSSSSSSLSLSSSPSPSSSSSHVAAIGPILNDGGILEPGQNATSFKSEMNRVKKILYVGKRTGRKISYAHTHAHTHTKNTNYTSCTRRSNVNNFDHNDEDNHNHNKNGIRNRNGLQKQKPTTTTRTGNEWLFDSPKLKVGAILLGELLHVCRPLYYIQSYRNHEMKMSNYDEYKNEYKNEYQHQHQNQNIKSTRDNTSIIRGTSMIKTWMISLAMDLLSHQCTVFGISVKNPNTTTGGGGKVGIFGQKNDQNGQEDVVVISSPTTRNEIYRRKMRLLLYLLRSPIFDHVTGPLSKKITNVLSRIIPFIGKPIATYFMDLLLYYQKWHFMIE